MVTDDKDITNKINSVYNGLNKYALCLTSDREEANDLTQDTIIKVLTNKEKYIDGTNFEGWCYTIMRNSFINNYRANIRHNTIIDKTDNTYLLEANQKGYDMTDSIISHKELMEGVDSLNENLRKPFVMYITGYQYNEIAEKLNLPIGTIKSRIHSARLKLQNMFSDFRYAI